jgi:probable HAF family extracellular repeat protein
MSSRSRVAACVLSAIGGLFLVMMVGIRVLSASSPNYDISDLGTLPSGSSSGANGLNANGQVAGVSSTLRDPEDSLQAVFDHAMRWSSRETPRMRDLGTLGGESSTAFAINKAGDVVGMAMLHTGENHACLWNAATGAKIDLDSIGSGNSEAHAVNDLNQVVGYYYTSSGTTRAFRWIAGPGMKDLGTLSGGTFSFAYGINEGGRVVGSATVVTPARVVEQHAFLWEGSMRDLGVLPGHNRSAAFAINNAAVPQVVGYSSAGRLQHAVLWSGGAIRDLGTLEGGTRSAALGINDKGEVVGSSTGSGGAQRAMRWSASTGMSDLNLRLSAGQQKHWSLQEARAINNKGQIAGCGLLDGQRHAFLLTPQ